MARRDTGVDHVGGHARTGPVPPRAACRSRTAAARAGRLRSSPHGACARASVPGFPRGRGRAVRVDGDDAGPALDPAQPPGRQHGGVAGEHVVVDERIRAPRAAAPARPRRDRVPARAARSPARPGPRRGGGRARPPASPPAATAPRAPPARTAGARVRPCPAFAVRGAVGPPGSGRRRGWRRTAAPLHRSARLHPAGWTTRCGTARVARSPPVRDRRAHRSPAAAVAPSHRPRPRRDSGCAPPRSRLQAWSHERRRHASPAAPSRCGPRSRPGGATTVGLVLLTLVTAFEAMGSAPRMPAVIADLGAVSAYGWPFSAFLAASVLRDGAGRAVVRPAAPAARCSSRPCCSPPGCRRRHRGHPGPAAGRAGAAGASAGPSSSPPS
jgi:hypothetical protein